MPTDLPTRSTDSATNERVLFITRKWGPAVGGMETYCERLTEELAKHRPVDVIALRGRANGQPPRAASLLLFPLTVLRRLIAQCEKPGIVHIGDMAIWPLALMAWLFFPAAKMVLSAHGTDVSYGARGGIRGSLYNIYLALGARLLVNARVIANSRATRNRLEQIDWNCSAVVPLATDLRGEAPPDFDARRLVFAGRMIRQKGLSWFVAEVLPLLPPDIRLTVIGTRWDSNEESALEYPGVEFLGPLPQAELARHFAQAACVVIPNIELANGEFEGFGLIAPEAASAGGVVLAAATGGLTDAVIDGETGFQVAQGEPQSWADKITEVLDWNSEKRRGFIARSQAKAQSHYIWSRVAAETAEAYSS